MALITVLWIIGLLGLLAASVGSAGRTHAGLAFGAVEIAKARAAADAGVHRAIFGLLTGDAERPWPPGGVLAYREALDDDQVDVRIGDEDGKIDLNAARPALLAGLLQTAGLDAAEARRLADRIDSVRGGRSFSGFRQLDDLRTIPGMSEPLFQHLRSDLTVYSGANGVDPARASGAALHAALGAASDPNGGIEASSASGADLTPLDDPIRLTARLGEQALPSRHLMFSIRASSVSAGGGRFVREAIIALDGGRNGLPVTIHAWRRGR